MTTPVQPISAMALKVFGSKPSAPPPSRRARNALTGALCWTQLLALSRSMVCSSVKIAMASSRTSLMIEEAEHALGDDVVLHFARAAEDRHCLVAQESARRVELGL